MNYLMKLLIETTVLPLHVGKNDMAYKWVKFQINSDTNNIEFNDKDGYKLIPFKDMPPDEDSVNPNYYKKEINGVDYIVDRNLIAAGTKLLEQTVCTADINGRHLVKIGLCHPETFETMREYWTENGKVIEDINQIEKSICDIVTKD